VKTILVDTENCIQCCNCQTVCKDEHCDNDWSPIATYQSDGQFWVKVHEWEDGSGSKMRLNRMPIMCQHCANPACMKACPEAVYRRDDGIVIIDPVKAKGHRELVDACPYGVIYYNEELDIAQKCTMCAHLLDDGWKEPRCVTACPVGVLKFVDTDDLHQEDMPAKLERLHPEYGTDPQVYYMHLPKPFVAGSVYSPTEELCLDEVKVTLKAKSFDACSETKTDYYGDFRFDDVVPGLYELTFEKEGYRPKTIDRLSTKEAINVGDVKLFRKPV
jgi:Fe-S-cluster-containing dehydrogenase component